MVELAINSLSVGYGRKTVLKDLTARFPPGAVTAIVGSNGAGKSTLLRAVAGLLPAVGEVVFDGAPVTVADRRSLVAYMPQDTSARSSLSLIEVVLLGRVRSLGLSISDGLVSEAADCLERFGLAGLADRPLDGISGGQRQLVYLAQALFRRPKVLLLDEPTAALDVRHQLIVLELVQETARRGGVTIAMAMHDLSLAARFADRFLCLHDGALDALGTPVDVLTTERLRRLYGVEAEVLMGDDGCPRVTPMSAI